MPKASPKKMEIFPRAKQAKREICAALRKAQQREGSSILQLSYLTGMSRSVLSRAFRYPTVDQLSFNQLFNILEFVEPRYRIMISN